MNTKFVIFVAIGSLLFAAIYGSSISTVYGTIACAQSKDGKTAICTNSATEKFYDCAKDANGRWHCKDITAKETSSTSVPSVLKDAIVKAQSAIGGNETTSSGLKGKILKGNDLLKGETLKGSQNTEPETTANGNDTLK